PARVDLDPVREPLRRLDAYRPRDLDLAEAEFDDRPGVMRDAAMPLPFVAARDPYREHGRATEGRRRVRRVGRGAAAVPETRRRAQDPRADRADHSIELISRRPRQRRGGRHAFDLAAEAR